MRARARLQRRIVFPRGFDVPSEKLRLNLQIAGRAGTVPHSKY
jgi:hypothetical protein